MQNLPVVEILNFGFLGVSFLFVFLGYQLVKQVCTKDIDDRVISLTKFFLKLTLMFMLFAGPLQWATVIITRYTETKKIPLKISVMTPIWEKKHYGDILLQKGCSHFSIVDTTYEGEFFKDEAIGINLELVIQKFHEKDAVLRAYQNKKEFKGTRSFYSADPTKGG